MIIVAKDGVSVKEALIKFLVEGDFNFRLLLTITDFMLIKFSYSIGFSLVPCMLSEKSSKRIAII